MSSSVLAVRAVTAVYARQLLLPVLWIGLGTYAIVMAIIIWIAYAVSPWWLLLAFLPTIVICVGLALWLGVWFTAKKISPDMDKRQKAATKKVVKKLNDVAEQVGTPRFVLIFRIARDVVFPPKTGRTLVGELADMPGELHRSFQELRKLF